MHSDHTHLSSHPPTHTFALCPCNFPSQDKTKIKSQKKKERNLVVEVVVWSIEVTQVTL